MNVADVHERIQTLAGERGLSSYELAKRAGMPQSSLYNMFERRTVPKIDTLERICEALDISLSEFFSSFTRLQEGCYVTGEDLEILEISRGLNQENRSRLKVYIQALQDTQKEL